MTKEFLRKKLLEERKSINNKEEKDTSILNALINQDFYKNAKTVMVYISYNSEVDTHALIKKMLLDGKTLAAPKCITKSEMEARTFFGLSDLSRGAYGILEPSGEILKDFDLIIVPGVGFNERLNRIGYGAGYYDRFLKEHRAVLVGLFYDAQKCDFKEEKTDHPLDYIITESKIYKRSK